MAQLRRLRKQFPDELVIIGVHSAKFPSEKLTDSIRQAVLRHGIEHPVVNDAGFKIWNAYAVRAWPTLVLIDPTGRIAGQVSGEILAEEMAGNITEVLHLHPQAVDRTPLDLSAPAGSVAVPSRPLRFPARLLLAGERMFIADTAHHRILQVRLDADGQGGEIERVIGSGEEGLRDGDMESAAFNQPRGLGLAGDAATGTLFIADTENHAVRAVDLETGQVRTLAGTGQKAHGRLALGQPTETPLRSPWAVLPLQNYLLIAMAGSHQIWVLIDERQIGPFAGSGAEALVDGPVAQAGFNQPSDLALGMGYLFVADPEASAVRAVSLDDAPKVMTLVGQGLFDFGDQDGPTDTALLQHPLGLAVGGQTIYVADSYNHKIKRLDPAAGQIMTLAGSGEAGLQDGAFDQAQFNEPEGLQARNGLLYIADTNNHSVRVADLAARQVRTFRLRGLERLQMERKSQVEPVVLPEVVVAPGQVRLVLDVRLPDGYKRNPDAPTVLRLEEDGREVSFQSTEEIAWQQVIGAPRRITLDLLVYYCREHNEGLCLIHDARLVIPVTVQSGGKREARIAYPVDTPSGW